MDGKINLKRLNEIHQKEDEIKSSYVKLTSLLVNKTITVDNLSFSYDGTDREYVLNDITLKNSEKKVTAIVDTIGSGKATLLRCSWGFMSLTKGKTKFWGNIPLQNVNQHIWRTKSGSVMPDGFIFKYTFFIWLKVSWNWGSEKPNIFQMKIEIF